MDFRFDSIVLVKDSETISAIQTCINQRALAKIPFSPITDIGGQTSLLDVAELRHYFVEIETKMRTREWVPFCEGGNNAKIGAEPELHPRDIPIWTQAPDQFGNWEVKVYETATRSICNECLGHKKVECPTCHGARKVECKNCSGSGKECCTECHGTGIKQKTQSHSEQVECWHCHGAGRKSDGKECWSCGGKGFKLESIKEQIDVPCIGCQGSGQVNCNTCHGRGEVNCTKCSATGKITCPVCDGVGQTIQGYALRQCDLTLPLRYSLNADPENPKFEFVDPRIDSQKVLTSWKQPVSHVNCVATWESDSLLDALTECHGNFADELQRVLKLTVDACPKTEEIQFYRQTVKVYCSSLYIYRFKFNEDDTVFSLSVDLTGDGAVISGLTELRKKMAFALTDQSRKLRQKGVFSEAFYRASQSICVDPSGLENRKIQKSLLHYMTCFSILPLLLVIGGLVIGYPFWQLQDELDGGFAITCLCLLLLFPLGTILFFRDLFFHCRTTWGRLVGLIVLFAIWLAGAAFAMQGSWRGAGIVLGGLLGLLVWRRFTARNAAAFNRLDFPNPQKEPQEDPNPEAPCLPGLAIPDGPPYIPFGKYIYRLFSISIWGAVIYYGSKTNLLCFGALLLLAFCTHKCTAAYRKRLRLRAMFCAAFFLATLVGVLSAAHGSDNVYIVSGTAFLISLGVIWFVGKEWEFVAKRDQVFGKAQTEYVEKLVNSLAPSRLRSFGVWGVLIALIALNYVLIQHDSGQLINERCKRISMRFSGPDAQYRFGLKLLGGEGYQKDETEGVSWLKQAAGTGYADAQYTLARCYREGRGTAVSQKDALVMYRKAAEQNHVAAQIDLAKYLRDGHNLPEAVLWFQRAANAGNAEAQFLLGLCFLKGDGTEKNPENAFLWFCRSGEQKYAPALLQMAQCYENGLGCPVNYTKALHHYQLVAEQYPEAADGAKRLAAIGKWWQRAVDHDPQAQYQVGMCFLNGAGVSPNIENARSWFEKASKLGNLDGIVALADCKFYGRGLPRAQAEAVAIYHESATKRHPVALFRLGECHEKGIVLTQNLTLAADFYRQAAERQQPGARAAAQRIARIARCWNPAIQKNDPAAQLELAKCYADGDGIAKNAETAFQWYCKSAEQNQPEALFLSGQYLENGIGCKQDDLQAVACYRKAVALNYTPALYALAERYESGKSVEQNLSTAHQLFAKAATVNYNDAAQQAKKLKKIAQCWTPAHKGEAAAQYNLAQCYRKGDGTKISPEKTLFWLKKAADQDYPPALYAWAQHLLKDKKTDHAQIVPLLQRAAQAQYLDAAVLLGNFYYEGNGIEQDEDKALALWQQGVAQKHPEALYRLGKHRFYGKGIFNSGKDRPEGIKLWTQAAEAGHAEAAFALADYYHNGSGLLSSGRDIPQALAFYEKAAHAGNLEAMYQLGKLLLENKDSVSHSKGVTWLKKAAELNHSEAQITLRKLQR